MNLSFLKRKVFEEHLKKSSMALGISRATPRPRLLRGDTELRGSSTDIAHVQLLSDIIVRLFRDVTFDTDIGILLIDAGTHGLKGSP